MLNPSRTTASAQEAHPKSAWFYHKLSCCYADMRKGRNPYRNGTSHVACRCFKNVLPRNSRRHTRHANTICRGGPAPVCKTLSTGTCTCFGIWWNGERLGVFEENGMSHTVHFLLNDWSLEGVCGRSRGRGSPAYIIFCFTRASLPAFAFSSSIQSGWNQSS